MRAGILVALTALLAGCSTVADQRHDLVAEEHFNGKSILFVGAHPDDETGLAPLLASACTDGGSRCHFVVAAESNSVGCILARTVDDPEDCSRVRREEMKRSAELFDGEVEFYGWDDLFYAHNEAGLERTLDEWGQGAGGRAGLVARLERTLRGVRPDVVLSLDPRHGSTCHPAHRGIALLLLEAISRLPAGDRPDIWFEQSDNISERNEAVAAVNARFGYVGWPDTAAHTVYFDATTKLRNGLSAYDYVGKVLRVHGSQYPKIAIGEERADAPDEQRLVPLASFESYRPDDYCTNLDLSRPTFDIPGNKEQLGVK